MWVKMLLLCNQDLRLSSVCGQIHFELLNPILIEWSLYKVQCLKCTGLISFGLTVRFREFTSGYRTITPGMGAFSYLSVNICAIRSCTSIGRFKLEFSLVHTIHSTNLTSM